MRVDARSLRFWLPWIALAGVVACVALPSCAATSQGLTGDADALRKEAAASLTTGSQCSAMRLSTEPDLVGWEPSARARLVSLVDQGLAVVRFEQNGCDVVLSVLSDCVTRKERYAYRPYSETQRKVAENERELYGAFPVAAARLRASLARGRGIRAEYQLAGVQRVPVGASFAVGDLIGRCDGATHVVSGIYRGAFVVGIASADAIEAEASLLGGRRSTRIEVLDRAGDPSVCRASAELTPGCDVPLRLELTPILDSRKAGTRSAGEPSSRGLPPPACVTDGRICPPRMAAIPAGTFFMGAEGLEVRDAAVHRVTLSPYCIDSNEVTVGDYEGCVRSGICAPVGESYYHADKCLRADSDNMDRPRNCARWREAKRYCEWLGKRLPTEAEWEYAARGGDRSLQFPWGNDLPTPELACWNRASDERPCRVGQFPAGAFGLKDMAGNLREWVWDWYGPLSSQQATDPVGATSGEWHVTKGGSYADEKALYLLAAWRNDERNNLGVVGFRCARDR